MTLRTKTLLASLVLSASALGVFCIVSWRTLLRGFAAVEDEVVRQNVGRLVSAVQGVLDEMDTLARDWAWWDDTYEFVATTNAQYIQANLTPAALANIRVNTMAFLDSSGRLAHGVYLDPETKAVTTIPDEILQHLAPGRPLGALHGVDDALKGIVLTPSGPLLVCGRPILTSQIQGPPRGTLVLARALDEDLVNEIGQRIGLSVSVCRWDSDETGAVWGRRLNLTDRSDLMAVNIEAPDSVCGYAALRDLYGQPALVAQVRQTRTIYARARRVLADYLIVLGLLGLVYFAAALLFLQKSAVARLVRLKDEVGRVAAGGPSRHRLSASGNDELAQVARSVNEMLDALEKAQADRQRSETRYRELFDRAPEVIYTLTAEGVITSLNPAFERLTGWSREEWVGRSFEGLVHPEDLPRAYETLQAVLRGEHPGTYELRVRAKSGEYLTGEFSSSPLVQDGRIVGEQGIARDITQRKRDEEERERLLAESDRARKALLSILEDERRTEEQLRQSEARFREMAALMPETVFEMDMDGRITFVNQLAYSLWGFTPEELEAGLTVYDIIVPEHWDRVRENISGRFKGYKGGHMYTARKKDGSTIPVEVYSTPILREGRPAGLRGVIIDISERVAIQKLQVAKEAAEAASRAKSEFLAKMSHELRTPLNVVIGYAEALEDELHGTLSEKQKEAVSHILSSSQHLLQLLNDMLELSRAEAGRAQPQWSDVAVRRLLAESLVAIHGRAEKQHLQVTMNLAPEVEELTLQADERRLRQVLFNLLTNAAKFTPEGGRITLSARVMQPAEGPACLHVAVADTGFGLKSEELDRVFEKFYQVPRPRMPAEGSGLGLALAREFVELHGGKIWAESAGEGQGSTFHFTIPLWRSG